MKMSEKVVLYDDGNMRVVAEFWRRNVYMHFRILRWTLASLRRCASGIHDLDMMMRSIGHEEIHAYFHDHNSHVARLARMFGFFEYARGGGFILTSRRIPNA